MRLISGTVKATPTPWLHVLSNIEPPSIRREKITTREIKKIVANTKLPIHQDLNGINRLKSRKPIWMELSAQYDPASEWKQMWQRVKIKNWSLIEDPTRRVPGFELRRRQWTTLNRLRTGFGRCKEQLKKWGYSEDDGCECGQIQSMEHLIQSPM